MPVPTNIDPEVREPCVRRVLEQLSTYPSLNVAAEAIARREGPAEETVRRWVV